LTTRRAIVLRLLQACGLMALWRFRHRRSIPILMFHGVMDAEGAQSPGWAPLRRRLSRRRLEECLATLSRHYRFVGLSEAVEMLAGRRPQQPYALVLTFDDGYRNNLTHALPLLRRYGAPASIFVTTDKISQRSLFAFDRLDYALQHVPEEEIEVQAGGLRRSLASRPRSALEASFAELRPALKQRFGAEVEYADGVLELVRDCERRAGRSLEEVKESDDWTALLTWEEVRSLAEDPAIEVGSHTLDHTRLGLASAAVVREQLRRSKREIEARTGKPCRHLAYPDGSYGPESAAIAREEGYASALTSEEGLNRKGDDPMTLRRIAVPVDASGIDLLARVCGLSALLTRLKELARPSRGEPQAAGPLNATPGGPV
jgi:peptidoglycan/xylan/chitin deacetylase (PgdA/CDA1 family)